MAARDASDVLSDYADFDDEYVYHLERSLEVGSARLTSSSLKAVAASAQGLRMAAPVERQPPHNLEAEQALLGAILVNNEALDRVSGFLSPDHFFDPLHGRIFETLATLIHAGKRGVGPYSLAPFFENVEPINANTTVPQYLGKLVTLAPEKNVAGALNDCAQSIVDLARRRSLIVIGEDLVNTAYDNGANRPLAAKFDAIEQYISVLRQSDLDDPYKIAARPYEFIPAERIPERPVMYGQEIRAQSGATVGRPGVGKTKLIISENLAKVSGRQLLHDVPKQQYNCWCWFGEECQDDLDRLVTAAMTRHGLGQADIGDRLFISSREQKLLVATHTRDGLTVAAPVVKEVKAFIRANGIDSLTIDPFVKSHAAPENDNGLIDQVVGIWSEIAFETNCHVHLYHHTRKTGGAPITIDDVRGGSAIVGAVRSVRILNAMTAEEAKSAGVDNAWSYIRIDDGKQNNLPPGKARWFHLQTVPLAHDDSAGVATPWEWPDAFKGVKVSDLLAVQKAVACWPLPSRSAGH